MRCLGISPFLRVQWFKRSRGSINDSRSFSDASSSLSDDIQAFIKPSDPPTLSRLFSDAAEYQNVLACSGCIAPTSSETDVSSDGFADLVGRDLDSSEKATAGHVARLRATRYSWGSDELTEEPDSYDQPKPSEDGEVKSPQSRSVTLSQLEDGDADKLEPAQVVDILIEEFGSLAPDDEKEKEKLVFEADGCMTSQDVFILGVIHVTTHRITFHASLLSTQAEVAPARIIKGGPAIMHRKGCRSKRRVWMELSHDMMCAYASNREDAKTRPVGTILLAFVNKLLPFDPKAPRYIRFQIGPDSSGSIKLAEFDTEESAQDWRRELSGAIFLHRHRRRQVLSESETDDNGIRLSCPLNRIHDIHFGGYPDFPSIATLGIIPLHSEERSDEGDSTAPQAIRLGPIQPMEIWKQIDEYVDAAKQMALTRPMEQYPVFIDFGSLNYNEAPLPWNTDDNMLDLQERSVRGALSLDSGESKLWIVQCRILRNISSRGYLVISPHFVCVWSKSLGSCDIKHRFPVTIIKAVKPIHATLSTPDGLVLEIKKGSSLKLVFGTREIRDEAITRISSLVMHDSLSRSESRVSALSAQSRDSPTKTLKTSATSFLAPLSRTLAAASAVGLPAVAQIRLPKAINLPQDLLLNLPSMHFVCLTIGSRGDVQPYIALGLGLLKEGHRVTIVTHEEYKVWVQGFGIQHRTAGGDPGALMKLSVENKMFSPEFFKESLTMFRPWLDQLLVDSWEGCKDADILLESPSAMAGVHIAEALNIPYFRTFTMPWTKTAEFPHAFLSPPVASPAFNSASYILFSNVFWVATSGQINKWRRNTLKIANTDMGHLAQSKIVFIYNFSQAVVPKPLDWGDTITISGYWFLDNPDLGWSPPPKLLEWMNQARKDGKPIVYIGFGSITVPHPDRVTARIVKAVVRSGVRAIISKGWSSRMSKPNEKAAEIEIPPECYMLEKIPHDWLFPQIDAALHHGGAGTTGASLRAGIPTLIKPWFGDQFFWASRVQKLGAGLRVPSLRVSDLSDALVKATTDIDMRETAAAVGERIRSEDGVHTAIHTIYTYLRRASLDRASLAK